MPTYHSDLQPIEIVWAWIKGAIARQYKRGDGLQELEERLVKQFTKVLDMRDKVRRIIEKTAALTLRMWEEVKREDDRKHEPQSGAFAVDEVQRQQHHHHQQPTINATMNNGDTLAMMELLETGNHVEFSTESMWPSVNI